MCLSTMPLFCDADWPKRWIRKAPSILQSVLPSSDAIEQPAADLKHQPGRLKLFLIASYVSVQLLLPWSHGLTQVHLINLNLSTKY
jgi:Vitamin K-dependent gamma-carboxylase